MHRNHSRWKNPRSRRYLLPVSFIVSLLLILTAVLLFSDVKDVPPTESAERAVPVTLTGAPLYWASEALNNTKAPIVLRAVSSTDATVTLTWSTPDNSSVKLYTVFNGTVAAGTTTVPTFTVSGLPPSRTYFFYIKAVDETGRVLFSSNVVTVTTKAAGPATIGKPAKGLAPSGKNLSGSKIVGYFAGWASYSGKQLSDLDGSKLTHLNYAFANIGPDLKIALGDPYADTEQVYPNDLPTDPFHGHFNQLLKLKTRYPHLKTLISVGGWSWSERFSDAARTKASREAFAESCVAFIVKYGFDGVDIDWEYPVSGGEPDNVRRPEDKQNFTYLMQELRERLDAQGAKDGKTYLLSFAGSASDVNNVELAKLQKVVDYINIMTYDYHGTWDSTTGLNAPLYKDPGSGPEAGSVDDSVQLYLSQGVPAGKLVVGVPFYGYKYDNVRQTNKGLYQTFNGGKSLPYSQIAPKISDKGYNRVVQESSEVPYLYNGSSFISYDDPESIERKAAYIRQQGLAGAMVWELSQDTADHDLLNALYKGLQ